MPEPTPPVPNPDPTPDPATPQRQPRGYFNQAQLEEIGVAEDVHLQAVKAPYKEELAKLDLDAEWLTGFGTAIAQARGKTAETGQSSDQRHAAKLNADGAERVLIVCLQKIQSAAKQKHRMLAEDDDPETNFPTDGYLIGQRLNPNRDGLLQNAEALILKAKADQLPGHKTDEELQPIRDALKDYRAAETGQSDAGGDAEADRIARDKLVKKITSRRCAVQNAIDGLYPYTDDDNAPVRRLFKLPVNRPFNG
ncbi:MAG: hypothetical protein RL514_2431 [Verrucomicrobiota bacterium]|jgi:hypothetical protein